MKPILTGTAVVAAIGLALASPILFPLIFMVAPLVVLALVSAWALIRGGGAANRRQPVMHERHVVTKDRPR